jgi:mRNA-degrading endonuclease toxin of MazEF toxin-antitoxin module
MYVDVMNDIGNAYAPYITIVPISSKIPKKRYPTDVYTSDLRRPGPLDGVIKCAYVFTVSKRIMRPQLIHHLDPVDMALVDAALKVALGIV